MLLVLKFSGLVSSGLLLVLKFPNLFRVALKYSSRVQLGSSGLLLSFNFSSSLLSGLALWGAKSEFFLSGFGCCFQAL